MKKKVLIVGGSVALRLCILKHLNTSNPEASIMEVDSVNEVVEVIYCMKRKLSLIVISSIKGTKIFGVCYKIGRLLKGLGLRIPVLVACDSFEDRARARLFGFCTCSRIDADSMVAKMLAF